jgi:hypothetical protein
MPRTSNGQPRSSYDDDPVCFACSRPIPDYTPPTINRPTRTMIACSHCGTNNSVMLYPDMFPRPDSALPQSSQPMQPSADYPRRRRPTRYYRNPGDLR